MAQVPTLDFSPDRPIRSRDADLLDRKGFAEHIAAAVRGWAGHDSLVLALYGQWGSGKSSLKCMVVDSLRSDKATSPYIVEFNPWQWAGQEQLGHAFFREIGRELGRTEGSEQAKASAKRWLRYAALLGLGAEVFAGTRRLALVGLAVIASLGVLGSFFTTAAVRILLGVIALLSFIGFALLSSSDSIAKAVVTYFSAVAEAEAKSLEEAKNELSELLRTLTRPMLVVIDDVDRLSGPELRLVFQLIKANADFPNLVYLVLFQREVVEEILTEELSTDGREYLKKIVQVGFNVPTIQRSKLEAILFSKLDLLLGGEAVQKLWDKERWTEIFIPGLGPYFLTLRDVYRFISSLSLHFAVFSQGDAFEVNPIDLISLEVLRVFEPEVYNALPALKDTLTRVEGFGSSRSHAEAAEQNAIKAIVQKASEEHRKRVEEILTQVFPPISCVFAGVRYSSDHSDSWYRAHRACHPDVFDKYFQLAIPEGELSHEEVERIVALAGDREAFVSELRATDKRNLLAVAIDRLQSYKETVSLDHAISFVTALFDIGDELPAGRLGISGIPPDMHAARIVYWYLKREPEIARREDILKGCVKQTTGIYLPCFVVALEGDKTKESREQRERLADDTGVKDLQELCVAKIRQAATDGTLQRNPRFGELLSFWLAWSIGDEARNWVGTLIESRDGLLSFLVNALREGQSFGFSRYSARSFWDIDLNGIERLVALELIEGKLAELREKDLEGKQRLAVEAFQKAMKRKREGKPRTLILDDELNDAGIEPSKK